jgi:hypothetical protein
MKLFINRNWNEDKHSARAHNSNWQVRKWNHIFIFNTSICNVCVFWRNIRKTTEEPKPVLCQSCVPNISNVVLLSDEDKHSARAHNSNWQVRKWNWMSFQLSHSMLRAFYCCEQAFHSIYSIDIRQQNIRNISVAICSTEIS